MTMNLLKRLRFSKDNRKNSRRTSKADVSADGVFLSTKKLLMDDQQTVSTQSNSSSEDDEIHWKSSGSKSHHRNAPLIVLDPDRKDMAPMLTKMDQAEQLGLALARSRDLPTTWYYSSNHIMINQERAHHSVAPLKRMRELDELARQQATAMASASKLFHMKPEDLHEAISSRRLGSNVAKGTSIRKMHPAMMENRSDRNNILDRRFTHFGMGTAKGEDGQLYLCQIFRG